MIHKIVAVGGKDLGRREAMRVKGMTKVFNTMDFGSNSIHK